MIPKENDGPEITYKNINKQKDLRALIFKYPIHNDQPASLGFHMSNFENDSFIVDWQLDEKQKT